MGEPVDRPEINVTSPVPGLSATMSRPVPTPNGPAKIDPGLSLNGMIVGSTSLKNPFPRLGSSIRLFDAAVTDHEVGGAVAVEISVKQRDRARADAEPGPWHEGEAVALLVR